MSAAATASGASTWMEQEIREQPAALARALEGRIDAERGEVLLEGLGRWEEPLRALRELRVIGCGTAAHAGQFASQLIESRAQLPAQPELAGEYRERLAVPPSHRGVLALSHSGETSTTVTALREARTGGALSLSITSCADSALARASDVSLTTRSGVERAIPSTKGFTTLLAVSYLLALELGQRREVLPRATRVGELSALAQLPGLLEATLDLWPATRSIAEQLCGARAWVFVGRGLGLPIAREGALKLKETSYVAADAQAAGELRHGPLAMLDAGTPVVLLAHAATRHAHWAALAEELSAIDAPRIVIADQDDVAAHAWGDHVLCLPTARPPLASILAAVPLQMLALHVAALRGNDVDRPRHLTKSVIRE